MRAVDILAALDDDERYVRAYLWPPRPGLIQPAMAELTPAELAWWAWAESRSTRRQIFAELIGRDLCDEVTGAAMDGYWGTGEPVRTAAVRAILEIVDPAAGESLARIAAGPSGGPG